MHPEYFILNIELINHGYHEIVCEEYWHRIFRYVSLYLTSLSHRNLGEKGRFDSMSEPDIPGFDPDEDYG